MSELSAVVSLRLRAGDDLVLEFVVTRDGVAVDITGMTVRFVARRRAAATEALTTEGVDPTATTSLTDPTTGVFRVSADAGDTADLVGTYAFQCDLQDLNTDISTVSRGFLTFESSLI